MPFPGNIYLPTKKWVVSRNMSVHNGQKPSECNLPWQINVKACEIAFITGPGALSAKWKKILKRESLYIFLHVFPLWMDRYKKNEGKWVPSGSWWWSCITRNVVVLQIEQTPSRCAEMGILLRFCDKIQSMSLCTDVGILLRFCNIVYRCRW